MRLPLSPESHFCPEKFPWLDQLPVPRVRVHPPFYPLPFTLYLVSQLPAPGPQLPLPRPLPTRLCLLPQLLDTRMRRPLPRQRLVHRLGRRHQFAGPQVTPRRRREAKRGTTPRRPVRFTVTKKCPRLKVIFSLTRNRHRAKLLNNFDKHYNATPAKGPQRPYHDKFFDKRNLLCRQIPTPTRQTTTVMLKELNPTLITSGSQPKFDRRAYPSFTRWALGGVRVPLFLTSGVGWWQLQ